MKNRTLQRAFAFALTLLLAFGSFGGLGFMSSAKAAEDPDATVAITSNPTTLFVGETGAALTAAVSGLQTGVTVSDYKWTYQTSASAQATDLHNGADDTKHTFASALSKAHDGYVYTCQVTLSNGNTKSGSYTLAIHDKLTSIAITKAPDKVTYDAGESFAAAGMEVTATYNNDSSTAKVVTGYTVSPDGALATSNDKVTISYTENGETATATQAITVNAAPQPTFVAVTDITGIPTAATANTPLQLTGTVEPTNATNQTITWSVKDAGTTGATISGNTLSTTAAGTVVVTATITNGLTESTNYTKDATITVSAPAQSYTVDITTQPQATSAVTAGSISGNLTVAATTQPAGGTLSYQWYSNTTNSNTGGTQIASANSASFPIPTDLTAGEYYYYCVVSVTDGTPATSNVAKVVVSAAGSTVTGVTINPSTAKVTRGDATGIQFTATVEGTNTPSQAVTWSWELLSNHSAGTTFTYNEAGVATLKAAVDEPSTTIKVIATSVQDATKSSSVTVTVEGACIVLDSTLPADAAVVQGNSTTLTCKATVTNYTGTPTYQWYSKSGSTETAIANANSATYTLNTTGMTLGDYHYFCRVTAGTSSVNTREATIKVQNTAGYKVTAGNGGTFLTNSTSGLKFTIDGDFSKFSHVVVGSTTLNKDVDYTAVSGSTVVTLQNSYLKKLAVGTYSIYFYYTDGNYASGTFYVNGQPYVFSLYPSITAGSHTETTWLGKGEKMRLTMYVANPTSTSVRWHYSSSRISLSSKTTQLYYDSNTGYYVSWIDVTPKYNGNVWVYAETNGTSTPKHSFTVVGLNNLPATGQDSRPIYILLGVCALTAAALGAMYVWKKRNAQQ